MLSCSGKYASSLVLEAVNKILPTEDEQEMIASYTGDDELGKP